MTSVKEILTQEEIQALLIPELTKLELAKPNVTEVEFIIEKIISAKELETLCSACEIDPLLFNNALLKIKNSFAASFFVSLVLTVKSKEVRLRIIKISIA